MSSNKSFTRMQKVARLHGIALYIDKVASEKGKDAAEKTVEVQEGVRKALDTPEKIDQVVTVLNEALKNTNKSGGVVSGLKSISKEKVVALFYAILDPEVPFSFKWAVGSSILSIISLPFGGGILMALRSGLLIKNIKTIIENFNKVVKEKHYESARKWINGEDPKKIEAELIVSAQDSDSETGSLPEDKGKDSNTPSNTEDSNTYDVRRDYDIYEISDYPELPIDPSEIKAPPREPYTREQDEKMFRRKKEDRPIILENSQTLPSWTPGSPDFEKLEKESVTNPEYVINSINKYFGMGAYTKLLESGWEPGDPIDRNRRILLHEYKRKSGKLKFSKLERIIKIKKIANIFR